MSKNRSRSLPVGLVLFLFAVGTAAAGETRVILDRAFLDQPIWDDGRAELSFYDVEVEVPESTLRYKAGTVLVKHDYDRKRHSKTERIGHGGASARNADVVASFQWGFFDLRDLLRKRSVFLHVRKSDLLPLKQTFGGFSLEGNSYLELSFHPDRTVHRMQRSDTRNGGDSTFDHLPDSYPIAQLFLLVRALDFSDDHEHRFRVLDPDGRYVDARVRREGVDTLELPQGPTRAERIRVWFSDTTPFPAGPIGWVATTETYWRGLGPTRPILKLESGELADGGSYRATVIERTRSKWWREDIRTRLDRADEIFGTAPLK